MVPDAFSRLEALIDSLSAGLVERRSYIRLSLLAALCGEHTLLIGPPGTAKSELARRLHLAFADTRYFERLLTRFTVPEELFGPLSLRALEDDRYERQIEGFLPQAGIAFVDEVFKANSAILNALLTLLNEREFDNGSGRLRCPLISVIGATNQVPEDELGDAFFDRFLVRLPVSLVSDSGFAALMAARPAAGAVDRGLALTRAEMAELSAQAEAVLLPAALVKLLAELRRHCGEIQIFASDRRWVKIASLLRMAAATAGRSVVSTWDLLLLPFCIAPDVERQAAVAEWLAARLGVGEGFSPPRLMRVVEAFEAQLEIEQKANDLDYDESGRIRFSTLGTGPGREAEGLADRVGDAKGGSAALRMTYTRKRRYGALHIEARVRQIDDALARIAAYAAEVATERQGLTAYRDHNLWLDDALLARVDAHLDATAAAVDQLAERLLIARNGFMVLPRLTPDEDQDYAVPEPVTVDVLSESWN